MIKNCPICKSTDLEYEESFEDGKNSITYRCNECEAEFIGISGVGLKMIYNPQEELAK